MSDINRNGWPIWPESANSLLSNQYGYDKQDQLTAWNRTDGKTGTWNLSLGGDWNSVTYDGLTETRTHDAAHELLARNATPLSYDPRGNLTADSEGRILTWDPENRLVSVTPATPAEGSVAVSFTYDTQWRRVGKTAYTWSAGAWHLTTDTSFTYDGWNLISEQSNGPTVQPSDRNYIWGTDLSGTLQGAGGIGGLLAGILTKNEEPGTKNLVYYHYQANGNIVALTDGSGVVAACYAYNPYGTLTTQSGAFATANPFRFSTKYTDDETGLVYYGYRYYSPGLGRWANRDPAEEIASLNLYMFVGNDPILGIDPYGDIEFGALLAISGTIARYSSSQWARNLGIAGILASWGLCANSTSALLNYRNNRPACFRTGDDRGIWRERCRQSGRSVVSDCGSALTATIGAIAGIGGPVGRIVGAAVGFAGPIISQLVAGGLNDSALDRIGNCGNTNIPVDCNCNSRRP